MNSNTNRLSIRDLEDIEKGEIRQFIFDSKRQMAFSRRIISYYIRSRHRIIDFGTLSRPTPDGKWLMYVLRLS